MPIDRESAKAAFDMYDLDGSGELTLTEMGNALKEIGIYKSEEDTKQIFDKHDLSGDGKVGFEEFYESIKDW